MKRRMLLAVAVAGALGSSVSSAETFFCSTLPDLSLTNCVPADSVQFRVEREPAGVAYQAAEPVKARPVIVVPNPDVTVTTYRERSWPNTEPAVSTYNYNYGPWIYYERVR